MEQIKPFSSKRFLFWWFVASFGIWPLSAAIGIGVALIVIVVKAFLPLPESFYLSDYSHVVELIFAGGSVGVTIGRLQMKLVNRYFDDRAVAWNRHSLVGGAIGATILFMFGITLRDFPVPSPDSFNISKIWIMVYLLCLTSVQWLALRHEVEGAWLWIMANGIGGLLWGFMVLPVYTSNFAIWIVATFALGGITGGALLYLFQTSPKKKKRKVEDEAEAQRGAPPE